MHRSHQEFLASLPTWLRKALKYEHSSFSTDENREWANNLSIEFQRRQEYEQILKLEPAEWNKYCRKTKKSHNSAEKSLSQLLTPKGLPGAPSKVDLAQEARVLQQRGMNFSQISTELNKRHGKGTTTPGAIRKLVKRHFPSRTKSNS
jgi:hypothetical protein